MSLLVHRRARSLVRLLLRLISLFFDGVGRGAVKLEGFDPDWAKPTYKLARTAVIVFAIIVGYPYIPGSQSDAFKGVSLFLGIVFSLGSSSGIADMIAGYMMTYRRAFKLGDIVKIGESFGEVIETRLLDLNEHGVQIITPAYEAVPDAGGSGRDASPGPQ